MKKVDLFVGSLLSTLFIGHCFRCILYCACWTMTCFAGVILTCFAGVICGIFSRLLADIQFDRAIGYYVIQVIFLKTWFYFFIGHKLRHDFVDLSLKPPCETIFLMCYWLLCDSGEVVTNANLPISKLHPLLRERIWVFLEAHVCRKPQFKKYKQKILRSWIGYWFSSA